MGGNVGIGTTSPGNKLHVKTSAAGAIAKIEGETGRYIYTGTDGSGHFIEQVATSAVTRKLRIQGSDGSGTYTQLFIDSGNQRIYTNSGVNVGIGTTSPDAPLHVEATNASIVLSDAGRSQWWRIQNEESTDALIIKSNDTNERMRIDSSGNVGIGVTPEAWHSSYTALQFAGNGALSGWGNQQAGAAIFLSQNSYTDQTAWKYISTDEASRYEQVNGAHTFSVATSGTADSAISWNTALTIDNSGKVGIGNATLGTNNRLTLYHGDDTSYAALALQSDHTSTGNSNGSWLGIDQTSAMGLYVWNYEAAPIRFGTSAVERMSIDASGNVGIKGPVTISEAGNTAGAAIDGVKLYKGITNASNFLAWQQGNMGWRLGIRHNDGAYPLTLYMNSGSTPTAASPGDEILRFGTDQNMALNNTTTGWSAWGATTSTHLTVGNDGNSPTQSNYGVLNLQGTSGSATHYSIGAGNGNLYMAYDYKTGAHRLTVNASGTFTGSASNDISDQRLKENIVTIPNALDKVKALKGRTFTWKASSKQAPGTKYGFIAQEVESVSSDLVYKDSGLCKIDSDDNPIHDLINYEGDAEYARSVQTSGIIPILVEAMKEQQALIESLTARITALEG
jgi:hypothetical protein